MQSWCQSRTTGQASNNLTVIEYSPDRSLFATMTNSGVVKVWSANNYRPLATLATSGTPSDVKFSKDGKTIAVASTNSQIKFYNTSSPFSEITAMAFNAGHGSGAVYLDYNSDSSKLATCGGSNNKVRLWDTTDYS